MLKILNLGKIFTGGGIASIPILIMNGIDIIKYFQKLVNNINKEDY